MRNESRIDWLGLSTNKPSFGQRFAEINELSDFIYRADIRFYMTFGGTTDPNNKTWVNGDFSDGQWMTGGVP